MLFVIISGKKIIIIIISNVPPETGLTLACFRQFEWHTMICVRDVPLLLHASCWSLRVCVLVAIHTSIRSNTAFFFSLFHIFHQEIVIVEHTQSVCLSLSRIHNTLALVTVSYFCFHSVSSTALCDIVGGSHTYMCRVC